MKITNLFIALAIFVGLNRALAQGTTAFTYQGQLHDTGTNANGSYTMTFTLYDSITGPTNQLGVVTVSNVTLLNGLFTVNLDYGNVFTGSARWLEIAVQSGSGNPETLSPRVQVLPSPYALYAGSAAAFSSGGWSMGVGNYASLQNALLIFNNGTAVMGLTTNASYIPSLSSIPKPQVFTSSGTFVVPAGVNRLEVEMWGGGGGGGNGSMGTGNPGGGGGGAGAYSVNYFQVTPGASYTVNVGGGGISGGGSGGTSSLVDSSTNTVLSAGGGGGGTAPSDNSPGGGGRGGQQNGSSVTFQSANGQGGALNTGGAQSGGTGAAAVRGGMGGWSNGNFNGCVPGGGGAGGPGNQSNTTSGGNGAAGMVIIYY